MMNGTVTEWRNNQKPKPDADVKEIHRLLRFWHLSKVKWNDSYLLNA